MSKCKILYRMKVLSLILITSVLAFILCSCSACKVVKPSTVKEIQFGYGGGVTGVVTTYSIKSDGNLWKGNEKIKKIPCDTLKEIIRQVESLPKDDFIYPDNTYSFVRIIRNDKIYYYAWSYAKMPDQQIIEMYKKLNRLL